MLAINSERPVRLDGLFRMETPAQYRKFAEECDRLAKQARAAHHRKVLEEMAQVWRELADGADGRR
ncbi:MAG TPA: hypothetical protein VJT13_06325 [Xanthobacteraceae bacterium]|nr:hypothetical protein [Xanthobacteraceae bacterium]